MKTSVHDTHGLTLALEVQTLTSFLPIRQFYGLTVDGSTSRRREVDGESVLGRTLPLPLPFSATLSLPGTQPPGEGKS